MMAVKILVVIILMVITALISGKILITYRFNEEVKRLFLQCEELPHKTFEYSQLETLPLPVRLYFIHSLHEGQPYISTVRMQHDGLFKTDLKKDWVKITGEEYFSTDKPGFVWKGSTMLFTARDMYLADKGRLVVMLFNLFKVVDAEGEKYNEGELLRWVGESVCFPTNLLPSQTIKWLPINSHSAKLVFNYGHSQLTYTVTFNSRHEISHMETERFMGDGMKEKWINKMSDYQTMSGVKIPTQLEAGWRLKDGYFPYARFRIREIDFDKKERF